MLLKTGGTSALSHRPSLRHAIDREQSLTKLDYTPGHFTVERHIRGKWVCDGCETLVQAPVPAHIIDKGVQNEAA